MPIHNYYFDCQTITLITIFSVYVCLNLNLKIIHAIMISRFTRFSKIEF